MPTSTFENLPENKKKIILEASIKEFKRVLLSDASINKIIKDANISRGSFYTYFKDIKDLYMYTLKTYQKKFYDIANEATHETKGDLIETTKKIYEKIIEDYKKDKSEFKHIFLNMNYDISIRNQLGYDLECRYKLIELTSKIDKKNLNIKKEEELFYIIDIIIGIVVHGLVEIFINDRDAELIKQKLDKQIQIIKEGIYK